MLRKDYSARLKLRHWVFIVACISLLVGQASLETQAAEQKHSRIHLFGKKLSDEEFYKLLNKTLGNNYESLQVTNAACNSGGFADKDFVKPHLPGTWSVTAARDVEPGMSVEVEDNGEDNTIDVPIAHEQVSTCADDPIASCWAAAGPSLATGLTGPGARSGPRGTAGCRGKSWPMAHPAPCRR